MTIGDWIGEHWDKFKNGLIGGNTAPFDYASDLFHLAFSHPDESLKNRAINAWTTTLNFGQQELGNAGGVISPALDLPGISNVAGALTWLQKTAVNRPAATAYLALADSKPFGLVAPTDLGKFFSPDTWHKAWNDSRYVSAGQALTYAGMVGANAVQPGDPNYDPRKNQQIYHQDWFYRTTSGSVDFLLAFVDPLRGVGKLAKFANAKRLGVVNETQIAKGALEQQTFGKHATLGQTFDDAGGQLSPGVENLFHRYQALDESTAARLYFNQYAYGGVVSTGLSAAAKAGNRAMFADVIMSARGSYSATQRLATYEGGKELAEAIGRYRHVYNVANITARQADDAAAYEVANAQAADAMDSIVSQVTRTSPLGTPEFGTLQNTRSALLGKPTPRVNPVWDDFRIGLHNFTSQSYLPLQVAPGYQRVIARGLGSAVRVVSPGHGWASHLMVNEIGSYRQFRANLERAGKHMDAETRNQYVTAYMAALTANERATIAAAADSHVIRSMAEDAGMTRQEAEKLIRDATMRRNNFRQMLNSATRFMPTEFRKRANELLKQGARTEASRLQDMADRYLALAKQGQIPGYYLQAVDDLGRPIFIEDKPKIIVNPNWKNPYSPQLVSGKGKNAAMGRLEALPRLEESDPLLTSHGADRMPMVDYQRFGRALDRFAKPRKTIERYESDQARIAEGRSTEYNISAREYQKARVDRAVSGVRGAVEDVYDALNHVWSIAAVLRPAQILRTLADDGMRSLTLLGIIPTLVNGGTGFGRIGYNTTKRGMTWAQERGLLKSVRALEGKTHHEIPVEDVGLPRSAGEPPSESVGYYNYIDPRGTSAPLTVGKDEVLPSLEAAVIQGRIDLDTFVAFLPWAARNGRLPFDLSVAVQDWAMGLYDTGKVANLAKFKKDVLAYLQDIHGDAAAWKQPRWQQDVADVINGLMLPKQRDARSARGIVFNTRNDQVVFTPDAKALQRYEFTAHRYLDRNPDTSEFDNLDGLHDFASDHADKLLLGNYMLHAKLATDGRIRFSIVRDTGMARPLAERLTPAQRKRILQGLKGPGSQGVRLLGDGRSVTIPGVFTGTDGDFARSAVSSDYIPQGLANAQRNADRLHQMNSRIDRGDIRPFTPDIDGSPMPNKDWGPAWEKEANQQLANDEVARMLLQGQEEAQVLAWLDSESPSALRYLNDRPKLGLSADKHVSVVRALVDYMAPPEGGQALRDKILRQEATETDFKAAVPERLWPVVNGQVTRTSLGTHPALQWAQRRIDGWFRVMQDKPMDFLVRYPFIEQKYKSYFEPMYRNYVAQVPAELITQTEIDNLARMARQKAIDDTKRYLYDQTFRTDLASVMSRFMPFSNAVADAMFKWTKIAYEKPFDTLANWNLVYNFPERAGIVYDQDGNNLQMRGTDEVWISRLDGSVMPDKVRDENGKLVDAVHDKYVAFQPPSWIANKIPGGLKLLTYNKNSMTSAIFDPSINVGPLIALPVNEFALKHPQFGENKFIKTYVLPFGPTSEESKMMLPGVIGAANKFLTEDESKASSAAMAIYQTQLTDFRLGKRSTMPTLPEAQQQAFFEKGLRFLTGIGSPISFQYNSPYKPYIDLYSQLLRKYRGDDVQAMEEFRHTVGDEYVYLAARVTKSNIALPSTVEGYRAYQKKQEAIAKYPELTTLITGEEGAGSFAKSVYEWEKLQTYDETGKTIRQEQTIADSKADLERRVGWSDFMRQQALLQNDLSRRGLKSINAAGAEDLKAAYQKWIYDHAFQMAPGGELEVSPWYEDFRTTDDAVMENRLTQMRQLLMEHPGWLQGRDDLQGLAQYLNARDQFKAQMKQFGYATLDSAEANWLQDIWQNQIYDIKNKNIPFGQLYDRWLTRDNLSAEGLSASEIVRMLGVGYAIKPGNKG